MVLLLSGALCGCQMKGQGATGVQVQEPGADLESWSPGPRSLRIYPSSRFLSLEGRTLLEARVEFLDEMGDSVKAVGEVRVELYPAADAQGRADRLYVWDVSLRSLAQQREHYESITRAYRFRLKLDEAKLLSRSATLVVTFTDTRGQRLYTQGVLQE